MKSQLRLPTILKGVIMGCADIVPGISGGTIAFIMGFYTPLIEMIKGIDAQFFSLLLRCRFRELGERWPWRFALGLFSGILIAFALFSNLFHFFLNDPQYRVYLYSMFVGLIAASVVFCAKQIKGWRVEHVIPLLCGATIAWILSGTALVPEAAVLGEGVVHPWLILCGMVAISAMLLPGISGSYMLTILGVYPLVIGAVANFFLGIKNLSINQEAAVVLGNLAVGIVVGAAAFSRVITWLFHRYHDGTIVLLTGFMVGAMRSVWPFWTYELRGVKLVLVEPYFPSPSDYLLWLSILFCLLGFLLVFNIERIANKKEELVG